MQGLPKRARRQPTLDWQQATAEFLSHDGKSRVLQPPRNRKRIGRLAGSIQGPIGAYALVELETLPAIQVASSLGSISTCSNQLSWSHGQGLRLQLDTSYYIMRIGCEP